VSTSISSLGKGGGGALGIGGMSGGGILGMGGRSGMLSFGKGGGGALGGVVGALVGDGGGGSTLEDELGSFLGLSLVKRFGTRPLH